MSPAAAIAVPPDADSLAPSRFRLPQHCSSDRRRARFAALQQQQARYQFVEDDLPGHPTTGFRLPRYIAKLPTEAQFTAPKLMNFMQAKLQAQINQKVAYFTSSKPPYRNPLHYRNLIRSLPFPPGVEANWEHAGEFSAQHLTGVNPLEIRRCEELPESDLAATADPFLKQGGSSVKEAYAQGRLFYADYPVMGDERVQLDAAERGVPVLVPTCLFWADPRTQLTAVAIRLRQVAPPLTRLFSPLDGPAKWSYAKFHAQVAHGAYHEGVRHLLETHLVSEVMTICTERQLHQDHPLYQLLDRHFRFTLAINTLARSDLLSPNGPIDRALSGGVSGALDAARVIWQTWDFGASMPPVDLARRGFGPGPSALEGEYWYPDDLMNLWKVVLQYVSGVLILWYRTPDDLVQDTELQAWAAEIARDIPGFPARFDSAEALFQNVAAIVFRASVMHAAVNNGQYETYGFIPNAPGFYRGPALEAMTPEAAISEQQIWAGLPDFDRALNQSSMAWVLSQPTTHDLFSSGESEAFSQALNPAARDAVAEFRRALSNMSDAIQRRNLGLKYPYPFLDPAGIACSVET